MSPEVRRPNGVPVKAPSANGSLTTRPGTKAWITLLTKETFLPGVLTLHYSVQRTKTSYPFVVLHTPISDDFPSSCLDALHDRGITTIQVQDLRPKKSQDFEDESFHEAWTKLAIFGLTDYERLVYLDADMLVTRNMDELMDLELDDARLGGKGDRVYASCHACVCNPAKREHYPKDWIPSNCAYTTQHSMAAEVAQTVGAPSANSKFHMPNAGLLVINPSSGTYQTILDALNHPKAGTYGFADQELLADVFGDRWVSLPYVYNALKTMRWKGVHDAIWRDEKVKNVHYIWSPKPWMMERPRSGDKDEVVLGWWWQVNDERERKEKEKALPPVERVNDDSE
ncbi:Nucleotide-diphospho-sugar transferase [Naviculisporaceae sp. PSN 640]